MARRVLRREYHAGDSEEFKRYTDRHRFTHALRDSWRNSVSKGHAKCNATADEIKAAFTGKCFGCGRDEDEFRLRLHMDHCHETGRFRGWLCKDCNTALGMVRNSVETLRNLMNYLTKFEVPII